MVLFAYDPPKPAAWPDVWFARADEPEELEEFELEDEACPDCDPEPVEELDADVAFELEA